MSFSKSPPERIEVPQHQIARQQQQQLKRGLKTAQGRCADSTTIEQECVADVGDQGFPYRAERGQVYDLRHEDVAWDRVD